MLEDFPQNLFQAKLFVLNCKAPSNVFILDCSKDHCQERIENIDTSSSDYLNSGTLSQKVKEYNEQATTLVPFLKAQCKYNVISTEKTLNNSLDDIYKVLEPEVIHIRPGASSNELRKEITDQLVANHGFWNLDINSLIRDENERKTPIGMEIHQMVTGNKIIPAEMIVRLLRRIVYSGDCTKGRFILTSFPDIIEQAKEFEQHCSKIKSIIYCSGKTPVNEIKNNNLSLFNIDSYFQKDQRLRSMKQWDYRLFQENMGNVTEFGMIIGDQRSGKSTLCKFLNEKFGHHVVDMKAIETRMKAKLGGEDDEPFEGEIPVADVEKEALDFIHQTCS